MDRLEEIRVQLGIPLPLSSAYRCPDYNNEVSSTGFDGPHTTGKAIDVLISGEDAFHLMDLAFEHGMMGVGVSQKGDHDSRFIHLDTLTGGTRPWVWSY